MCAGEESIAKEEHRHNPTQHRDSQVEYMEEQAVFHACCTGDIYFLAVQYYMALTYTSNPRKGARHQHHAGWATFSTDDYCIRPNDIYCQASYSLPDHTLPGDITTYPLQQVVPVREQGKA